MSVSALILPARFHRHRISGSICQKLLTPFFWPVVVCISVFLYFSSILFAQAEYRSDELLIRKVYVPQENPAEWPQGDWRPISTRKFLQMTELRADLKQRSMLPEIQQARYACRFVDGRLTAGTLTATVHNPTGQPQWISLGRTNLPLNAGKWSQTEAQWGTAADGTVYLFHPETEQHFSAAWQQYGQKKGEGIQFELKLLRARQTEFQIELPVGYLLSVSEPAQMAVFKQSESPTTAIWNVVGLETQNLNLQIQPDSTNSIPHETLSRQSHAITCSPAETTLITEIRLESVAETLQELQVKIPAGLEPELITLQQEPFLSWSLIDPAAEKQEPDFRILKLPLNKINPPPEGAIVFRIRSRMMNEDSTVFQTRFPVPLATVHLETLVNLAVVHPLELQTLVPAGLYQIDTRLVGGVRDVWSFRATEAEPELSASVKFPESRLFIDQLLRLRTHQRELTVQQIMLWSSRQGGGYGAEFQVHPGFDVSDVQILHSGSLAPKISWHLLRLNKKQILQIQLPNQLIAGQELPLMVTLKPKGNPASGSRLTLPPLKPLTAVVEQTIISDEQISQLKLIPAFDMPVEASLESRNRWKESLLAITQPADFVWPETATLFDVSRAERFSAEIEWEQTPAVATESHTENAIVLTTELHRQLDHGRIRYQLLIPAEQRRLMNSLRVIWNEALPLLQWKSANQKMTVLQQSSGLQSPDQILLKQNVSGQTTTLQLNWINSREQPDADILLEAYAPLKIPTETKLALPTADTELPVQGKLIWWETDFSCEQNNILTTTGNFHHRMQGTYPAELNMLSMEESLISLVPVDLAKSTIADTNNTRPGWIGTATLLQRNRPQAPLQTTFQLIADQPTGWLGPLEIQFPGPVQMLSLEINGREIVLPVTAERYQLPECYEPIHQINMRYQALEAEKFLVPILPSSVHLGRFSLLLSGKVKPARSEQVLFWQQLPRLYASSLDKNFRPFADVTNQLLLDEAATLLLSEQNYGIFVGALAGNAPASITIQVEPAQSAPLPAFMLVFALLLLAGWITVAFSIPVTFWWWGTGLSLLFLLSPDAGWQASLWPWQITLLASALLNDFWLSARSWLLAKPTTNDRAEPSHPLAILLPSIMRGTAGVLLLSIATPVSAQIGAEGLLFGKRTASVRQYDVLIPIATDMLKQDFHGMPVSEYPAVVYISAELSEVFNERSQRTDSLDQILYTAANYDLSLSDNNQLQVSCQIHVTDPRMETVRRSLLLPIKQLESLNSLTAKVNGTPVSLSPLADGSGLEIPLPDPQTRASNQETETVSSTILGDQFLGAELDAGKSFRKYQIELAYIPQQTTTNKPISLVMFIPPAMASRFYSQLSNPWQTKLLNRELGTHFLLPIDNKPFEILVGSQTEIPLEFHHPDPASNSTTAITNSSTSLETALFCQLNPDYVEYQIRLKMQFRSETQQELNWLLPKQTFVRQVLGTNVVDWRMFRHDGPGKIWKIRFQDSVQSPTEVLLSLIEPLNTQRAEYQLALPQLLTNKTSNPPEWTWLIGLQSNNGEFLQQVEFPQAASSRIPRETFLSVWPEPALLREDIQCFQVKKPQFVLLKRGLPPTEIQLDATHYYRAPANDSGIELISRLSGFITGPKIWTVPLQINELWHVNQLKASVNGRDIGVRLFRDDAGWLVAFSEKLNGPFVLQIDSLSRPSRLRKGTIVTPPRIRNAIATTEQLSWQDQSFAPGWALAIVDGTNKQQPVNLPHSENFQLDTTPPDYLLIEPTPPENLPPAAETDNNIQEYSQPEPEVASLIPLEQDLSATDLEDLLPAKRYSATALLERAVVDHQLWSEESKLFGQTIISWKREQVSPLSDIELLVNIPADCVLLAIYQGNNQMMLSSGTETTIQLTAGQDLTVPLILFWHHQRQAGWTLQRRVPIPEFPQIKPSQTFWTTHQLAAGIVGATPHPESFARYVTHLIGPLEKQSATIIGQHYPLWLPPEPQYFSRVAAQGDMQKSPELTWTPASLVWQILLQASAVVWLILLFMQLRGITKNTAFLNRATFMLLVLLLFAGPV